MDKAYWDEMRWEHFRWDVSNPLFDQALEKFEKSSAKSLGGVDSAVAGSFRAGKWRAGVYLPLFDEALEKIRKQG